MKITIDIPREMAAAGTEEIEIRIMDRRGGKIQTAVTARSGADGGERPSARLSEFVGGLVEGFREDGKVRLTETYASALRSFMRYRRDRDVNLDEMDQEMMADYEESMRRRGLTANTTSFYMRILRAAYNRAVRAGLTEDRHPFDLVFMGHAKTVKRAVTLETIQEICRAQLTDELDIMARDIFMFSFYTRGMAFVDIANLKKSDLRNGYLVYSRQKTGQKLKIAWHEEMQKIVDRHPSRDTIHLLGLLDATRPTDLRKQYHARQSMVNIRLKGIARRLGLRTNLTMYVARHSWASIAKELNVPVSVISDGMGHTSERTTQIYLKSIDAAEIDRNNEMMIEMINKM